MSRRLAAVLLVLAAAATATASGPAILVHDAWVRGSPLHGAAAAYLILENRGPGADRLVRVSSPAAGAVELHESRVEDGVMRMRPVEGIPVPAGSRVRLAPGGLHVMLMGLHGPLSEGGAVPLTLTFESGLTLRVDAVVRSR